MFLRARRIARYALGHHAAEVAHNPGPDPAVDLTPTAGSMPRSRAVPGPSGVQRVAANFTDGAVTVTALGHRRRRC
ncbi:MAG: hypothetical protein JO075_06535 [Acidimicrobiia bacterium]|nr:hypothetical protein [Acidimicrobiia bacterium]